MTKFIVTAKKLNKRSIIPANLPDPNNIAGVVYKDYIFDGQEVDAKDVPNASLGKWYKGIDGYFYWGGGVTPRSTVGNISLTAVQISSASGASGFNTQKFSAFLIETCTKYSLETPVRQLCFLAQTGHESGGLFYTEELASGQAYEGREDLGNTHPGDGARFKGRGLIQITGRDNYQWLSHSFNVDFIAKPSLLGGKNVNESSSDQLKYSALSAGWFWSNNGLNAIADQIDLQRPIDEGDNLDHFKLLTHKINGGYNGLNDRIARYKAGVQYFK